MAEYHVKLWLIWKKVYDDLINLYLYAILIISLKLNMEYKMFSELYFFQHMQQ